MCISQGRKEFRRLKWDSDGGRPARRLMATTAMTICLASTLPWPSPALAQATASKASAARSFNVPAQPLADALNLFGRQSGLQVTLAASASRGVMSRAVVGTYAPEEALARMLAGTGIDYRITAGRTAVIGAAGGGAAVTPADGSTSLDPISVFGDALGVGEIVIGEKELQQRNPANIADVFRGEPGIAVGSSLPMSQKVYVHGIEENNLAVTMDGGRQNNKVFHHNATNLIDPSLLKAVRVDAGIAPADAGPGALGGAIAYQTKDARDLLDGDGYGGFVSSNYNFNSKTFQTGLSAYGMQEGFEFLGYFNFAKGDEFKSGTGSIVEGTRTDLLSGLGKVAYEFESGDRFELSHERVYDDAPRPFRANTGFISGRPPWEPRVRDYTLDRQNTVFSYTDSTPEGWWDPTVVLAYSSTRLEIPIFPRPVAPSTVSVPYPGAGETGSFNGKVENKFNFDIGSITAGFDFYNDKAELEDPYDASTERARNVGIYAQRGSSHGSARVYPSACAATSNGLPGPETRSGTIPASAATSRANMT